MRLGSFWGFTAPMLVLAFDDREEPKVFFDAMAEKSNTKILHSLQKELMYLTRIKAYQIMKPALNTMQEIGNDCWAYTTLAENPEYNRIFKEEIVQRVVCKVAERESRGRYSDVSGLYEVVNSVLESWNNTIDKVDQLVIQIVSKLPKAERACVMEWADQNSIGLKKVIADSVWIDGKLHKFTEKEKLVVQYYLSRMSDVEYWISLLYRNDVRQMECLGIPFSQLARRRSQSIKYAVAEQFERIKSMNNEKILMDVVQHVRDDTVWLIDNYGKFVSAKDNENVQSSEVVELSSDEKEFFAKLHDKRFAMETMLVQDQRMLLDLYKVMRRVDTSTMENAFGFSSADWNETGKQLSCIGICGINEMQSALFAESVANTVISFEQIYKEKEEIEEANRILQNDVLALLDTIIPVGEVIHE